MQKARSHPRTQRSQRTEDALLHGCLDALSTGLLPLVGTRFQVLFHSPPGVLFTFPSRYWCTIGHGLVFSLGGWSPQLPTGFLVPRRTQGPRPSWLAALSPTGLSPPVVAPSSALQLVRKPRRDAPRRGPTTPAGVPAGLGSSPFARRY